MTNRRTLIGGMAAGAAMLGMSGTRLTRAAQGDSTPGATPDSDQVTVVLVHGAFADGSSWTNVMNLLLAEHIPVMAFANPLTGIALDSALLAGQLSVIPGPVLLVGHSYGGAVITVASTMASNVVGLVYVAAFAPDEGEAALDVLAQFTPTLLGTALRPVNADADHPLVIIDPTQYREVFAADLDEDLIPALSFSQRPAAGSAFYEPSGPAGWKDLPSWYALATADNAVGAEAERFYAERAGATITEIDGSHSIAVSQPEAVTGVILDALASVS